MTDIPPEWIEKAAQGMRQSAAWSSFWSDEDMTVFAHAALAAIWPDVERREVKLKEALDDLWMHAVEGHDLVTISTTEWDQVWRRLVADFPEFGDTP